MGYSREIQRSQFFLGEQATSKTTSATKAPLPSTASKAPPPSTVSKGPPPSAGKIDDAAKKLSEASYPFLKEIDWTSDVYGKLPTQSPTEVIKAVDSMLKLGAAMDPAALKTGVQAHSKAIGSMDGKLLTSLADYTAVNGAIGHMIASAPASKTMDVYNAFAKFSLGSDVGPYMMSKVNQGDAESAYKAFLEFKDVVKASQR